MITFLKGMLEVRNFDCITTYTIQFDSRDKKMLVTSWIEIMTSKLLFQNASREGNFADIIEIATIFIKRIRVKRIRESKNAARFNNRG